MAKNSTSRGGIVVIGLGRFGGAVAQSLVRLGHEVLAIDEDADLVQRWSDKLTHVVQADSTDSDALRQLGVQDLGRAVVGIGTDIEASVLTVLALHELGVDEIWAKAITAKHGQILERTGAHHVVYPEAAMGERVAHLVTGRMIDFIEFDDGFAIAKTSTPREAAGATLGEFGAADEVRHHRRRDQTPRHRLHICPPGDDGGARRPADRVRPHQSRREVRGADVAAVQHQ